LLPEDLGDVLAAVMLRFFRISLKRNSKNVKKKYQKVKL